MTHVAHAKGPLNRPVLRSRMVAARIAAGIVAVALAAASGLAAEAQDDANKAKFPTNPYATNGMIELGGHMISKSGSEAMWSTMVNGQTGPRILAGTVNMHSIDTKKTPFFDGLSMNNFGYGGEPYASTTLRMFKGKGYKFDADFHRNRQYFDYNLFGNPLIPSDAYPYVPVLHAPHLFNTVRWSGSANLTVAPLSRVIGRVGYWRSSVQGPTFSSNVSKSLTNPLLNQWWQLSNETWSGGIDWKVFRKTVVSYDQLLTSYQQDTTWSLNKFEY